MELFLQRHGRAFDPDPARFPDDALRPLTADGERRMEAAAKGMLAMKLEIELILTSPLVRAKETAVIVAEALGLKEQFVVCPALSGGKTPADVVKALKKQIGQAQRVLAVGHQPDLGRLVSYLTTGQEKLTVNFKKGGLCKLIADTLKPGQCAHLEWLLTPGQLKKM